MHQSPAGPPLSARVIRVLVRLRLRAVTILGPVGTSVVLLRRTRVLPVTLTALALGAFAVSAPRSPYDDDARSTAALSSTSRGEEALVPATGDGWTQDGVPATASPSELEEGTRSSSPSSEPSESSGAKPTAPSADVPATSSASDVPAAVDTAPGSTSASRTTTAASSSSSSSSSSSASSPTAETSASAATSSETPEVTTPTADPTGVVLAAVNTARVAAGCGALAADAALASLAAEHAAVLVGGSPPDVGGRTTVVATGTDPAAVAAAWLGDDTLLDCDLSVAGIGITDGSWTLIAA